VETNSQKSLCISVRFLTPSYHGRGDEGEPEWPPSPLRLYQALVAAAAGRWNERGKIETARACLLWLEKQSAPTIIAAEVVKGSNYRSYVPDNIGDHAAGAWSRGNPDAFIKRTEKDIQPLWFRRENAIHYLWAIPEGESAFEAFKETLSQTVRSITHLGWGIDMVVADARIFDATAIGKLGGDHWLPGDNGGKSLRSPMHGTLENLEQHYEMFLNRLRPDRFSPVPPLARFRTVQYRGSKDSPYHSFAAFSLLKVDASGFRAFDPVRNGMKVAGMLRHSAGQILGKDALADAVMGHGETESGRVAFVPLPTIEFRGEGKPKVIGSVRRALLIGVRGFQKTDLMRLAQGIASEPLREEGTEDEVALLSRLPNTDNMVKEYLRGSTTWATVTPMILPGYDDPRGYRKRLNAAATGGEALSPDAQKELLGKLDERIEGLIRKAILQGGFSKEIARAALVEWSGSGFWAGVDLASRYSVPEKLRRYRRVHVRIRWRDDKGEVITVPGPLCLGSGRFVGLGLFAPQE
jgi:CRISPR-associated protein Csb2